MNIFASSANSGSSVAMLHTKFTANGSDAYRIDHYTETAQAGNGLGEAVSDGTNETYLTIVLRKL